jgi:hypothetical protein
MSLLANLAYASDAPHDALADVVRWFSADEGRAVIDTPWALAAASSTFRRFRCPAIGDFGPASVSGHLPASRPRRVFRRGAERLVA